MMLAAETAKEDAVEGEEKSECPMKKKMGMPFNSRLKLSEKEVISNVNLFMFGKRDYM